MPRWLLWSVVAILSWGLWAVVTKPQLLGDSLSAMHSQALSTAGLVPVLVAMAFSRKPSTIGRRGRGILCATAAGALNCFGNAAYYHALSQGGKAATVAALTALYPLVTILLAFIALKEKLSPAQLAGIVLSLVAIYLLSVSGTVSDDQALIATWLRYALVPIVLWGIAGLLQKLSTNHVSAESATLWFLVTFVPATAIILWYEPLPVSPSLRTGGLVFALGFFFALGSYALLAAFAHGGKASIITPLTALYPVVTAVIAVVFLDERLGRREIIGISLALLSGAALSVEPRKPAQKVELPTPVPKVPS